jgi:hypothetical protein
VCLEAGEGCDEWYGEGVVLETDSEQQSGVCSYYWNTTGYGTANYSYSFRIRDGQGNLGSGEVLGVELLEPPETLRYEIELFSGWNLFSLPVIPLDSSIEGILAPIRGRYTKVYYYDTRSGHWESYNPSRSVFDPPNSLLQLNWGKGYWIEMDEPVVLDVEGYGLDEDMRIELFADWNYVGYVFGNPKNCSSAVLGIAGNYYRIYSYNAELGRWEVYRPYPSFIEPNTFSVMEPGKGYLFDMKSDDWWG